MNDFSAIDGFLATFITYIDSGFGLISGDVTSLAAILIVIDVTLAALFWAWGSNTDIIQSLVKKTLYVGAFAFIQGSKDAALELELPPGMYTVEVRSVDTAQVGTYLIETYQMSAASINPVIVTQPSISALGAKG